MLIKLKNKDRLNLDEFTFRCSIGKNGINSKKREGDLCTPKGNFLITKVFYRSDKIKKINTKIKKIKIKKNMGWCNDPKHKKYNSLINIKEKIKHEKLYRRDRKYDLIIIIDYNLVKPIPFKGSAIFIHLTKNYNKIIKIKKKNVRYEKLFRRDYKYDFLIPINYNTKKTIIGRGSAIFIHLTNNYKPTAGCIALRKNDMLVLLKLINKKTKIKIN